VEKRKKVKMKSEKRERGKMIEKTMTRGAAMVLGASQPTLALGRQTSNCHVGQDYGGGRLFGLRAQSLKFLQQPGHDLNRVSLLGDELVEESGLDGRRVAVDEKIDDVLNGQRFA
jgi:hypothetical protein